MSLHHPDLQRWVALACSLIIVAALLRRFAPRRSTHLRPTLSLLGVAAILDGIRWALRLARPDLADDITYVVDITQLFAATNLGAILIFDLGLLLVRARVSNLLTDLVIGLAYIVEVIHTLHRAHFNLNGLVATSAVVSGVIGLSLAPTLGNVIGGVALQLDNSIREGDWIQLDANTQGRVKEIRWRHTLIETRNWDTIVVPNSTLLSSSITILGRRAEQPLQRRYWVYFFVDFRFSPSLVIDTVTEALLASPIPNVARDPKPNCICMDLAPSGNESTVRYAVRFWLTDLACDDPTCSLVRERLYAALLRAGIPLALPGHTIFLSQDDENHRERKQRREQQRRVELLRGLALFQQFTDPELEKLAAGLHPTPFARGEAMTQQGRVAHYLYLLVRGAADVVITLKDGQQRLVRQLAAPNYFGEMGLMVGEPRAASVIATQSSECYRLDKATFEVVLRERPALAEQLASVITIRRQELTAAGGHDTAQPLRRMDTEHVLHEIRCFFGLSDDA